MIEDYYDAINIRTIPLGAIKSSDAIRRATFGMDFHVVPGLYDLASLRYLSINC